MFDLLISNGMVVDGTGTARRRVDVAVKDGRIAGVGRFDGAKAKQVINAEGHVVAPGFIDIHTHYDPQMTFEPYATSSCYHGVTTVVTGNCGFGLAPTRPEDRDFVVSIFARVEEMNPKALAAIPWDFETFPEYVASRKGKLGINAACYVSHSNLRRYVMGKAASEREATLDEIEQMQALVSEAMEVGAAGLSSSHCPTDMDMDNRPVPSRFSSYDELRALVQAVGRSNRGSISYLPKSAIGGLTPEDGDFLMDLGLASGVPIIIQGLGARSKVDAPTATWPSSKAYLDRARELGAPVYSMLMARPYNRKFNLADGTSLYEGVPEFHRLFTEAESVVERLAMLNSTDFRNKIRHAVEERDLDLLPPPAFDMLVVTGVEAQESRDFLNKTIAEIAVEKGIAPMDALANVAIADGLRTEFTWRTENEEWREATCLASRHPQMIVGTSDAGAHLGRDDGAEMTSYFFKYWVREWEKWTLEEAVRELSLVPASLMGFRDRGVLAPGNAADIVIFDHATIGPDWKQPVNDFPGNQRRWASKPKGVKATIVNGTPVVLDGMLVEACGLPGEFLAPL
ncbi:N-acyl-D-amino-acid deacylase family protein [Parahaliea mediterranea]|uniref:Amidohydrolase family protein n=1 Tax=Parahaliea mediterranea TaxID=651086 RepID=A0A939DES0_9GAMM|nr:amidohydrolase family protein [Parahaliea mediterranea]MBN7796898.1 amidohydrolase family protein [Parahaliea mediterranea]